MLEEFQIKEVPSLGGSVVVRVKGQLDVKTTAVLVQAGKKLRGQGKNVVLNLSEVTFIASNGIGGLLSMVDDFKRKGLKVRLASLSLAVSSVLQLLNLDQYLDIDPSETAAVAALEG